MRVNCRGRAPVPALHTWGLIYASIDFASSSGAQCQVAESKGLLAEGSRVQVVFRGIAWWRQTTDKFDAVISELPFGVSRCLSAWAVRDSLILTLGYVRGPLCGFPVSMD